ncbi:MAG: PQQ-binding-like beta-propeller repeat protein [Candidatus Eremiobacterota bacterium]
MQIRPVPTCRIPLRASGAPAASEPPPPTLEAMASAVLSEDNLEALTEWTRPVEGAVRSAPTLLPDGSVCVGTSAGRVYLFGRDGQPRWDKRLDGEVVGSPIRMSDGSLLLATRKGHVHCFDPSTGRERWSQKLSLQRDESASLGRQFGGGGVTVNVAYSLQLVGEPLATSDGRALLGTAGGVHVFRPDGRHEVVRGTEALGPALTPYGTQRGDLFVTHEGVGLKRLDAYGRALWTYPGQGKHLSAVTLGPDGTSYFCAHEAPPVLALLPPHVQKQVMSQVSTTLIAVDSGGKEVWRKSVRGGAGHAPVLGSDGKLYLGTGGGMLYAVDPKNGTEIWSQDTGTSISSAPAPGPDGTVFTPSGDQHLYAYTPEGRIHWRYARPGWGASTPVPAEKGRMVVGGEGTVRVLKNQDLNAALAAGPTVREGANHVTIGGVRVRVNRRTA